MKTISIKIMSVIFLCLITTNTFAQEAEDDDLEIEELTGTFEGFEKEQNQYLFTVIYDEDGIEEVENYKFIIKDAAIESKYNLKNESLIGQSFLIKYTVHVVTELNEEGEEDFVEVYTIKDITLQK